MSRIKELKNNLEFDTKRLEHHQRVKKNPPTPIWTRTHGHIVNKIKHSLNEIKNYGEIKYQRYNLYFDNGFYQQIIVNDREFPDAYQVLELVSIKFPGMDFTSAKKEGKPIYTNILILPSKK